MPLLVKNIITSAGFAATGRAKGYSTVSGQHQLYLSLLPAVDLLPRYKAWSYLVHNEVAVEIGRKLFYTDCHGTPQNQAR